MALRLVVLGARFGGNRVGDAMHQVGIEARAQADGLGENGGASLGHAVQRLVPPVVDAVRRDAESPVRCSASAEPSPPASSAKPDPPRASRATGSDPDKGRCSPLVRRERCQEIGRWPMKEVCFSTQILLSQFHCLKLWIRPWRPPQNGSFRRAPQAFRNRVIARTRLKRHSRPCLMPVRMST